MPARNAFHALIGFSLILCSVYLLITSRSPAPASEHFLIDRSVSPNFMMDPRKPVVIYNRIPKTASTSVMSLAYALCTQNHAHILHLNISRNSHVLSLSNQLRLVRNISLWHQVRPALFHGHFAFVDFSQLGSSLQPLYINVVREPLERLVSYYYFLRFGDDFRPHLVRHRMRDPHLRNQTFDECIIVGGQDCDLNHLWVQIPFFCGHAPLCRVPGNADALTRAKHNLLNKYFLVGTTDLLEDFVRLLDMTLPQFFQGSLQLYQNSSLGLGHRRRTKNKQPLQPSTVDKVKQSPVWQMEHEFFQFAKNHFVYLVNRERNLHFTNQKIFYEKIRSRETTRGGDRPVLVD